MNGRPSAHGRVCFKCIAKLSPRETAQVNWQIVLEDKCQICSVKGLAPEAFTKPFLDFLRENPTVFHAVDYFKTKLDGAGYVEVFAPAGPFTLIFDKR